MSVFSYNGVEISFIHTQRVSESVVPSEDKADALYRRVEIAISGLDRTASRWPMVVRASVRTATASAEISAARSGCRDTTVKTVPSSSLTMKGCDRVQQQ